MPSDAFVRSLRAAVRGDVRDDGASRAAYAYDASNHRVLPRCVVLPRDTADVVAVVRACAADGVPVTARGGGTSVAGSAIGHGVVLDLSRHLAGVLSLDPDARTARVLPGTVLDDLRRTAEPHGLTVNADPSTHDRATLGGMVGTNACGTHSVAWGTTADAVEELEVVLADGSVREIGTSLPDGDLGAALSDLTSAHLSEIRTGLDRFPRQSSGYALHHLLPERRHVARALVGSEGTCALVTGMTLRLVSSPPARALVVLGFPSSTAAAAAAPALVGLAPLAVEGMDAEIVRTYDSRPGPQPRPELPPGRAWLLVETGGDTVDEAVGRAQEVLAATGSGTLVRDPGAQRALWRIRERGAGLASRTSDGREAWPGWEDAAVPVERLAEYLEQFEGLMSRYGRRGALYGHFGEGCVHVRIDHDLLTPAGRVAYRSFQTDAADLAVSLGGSLTGEHGDGRARSELLARMYPPSLLSAFAAFKHAFDPDNLLNPGVIVDPVPLDSDLRAALSRPHRTGLEFAYPHDDGDFAQALRRCTGVGACRRTSGGGMCPSYRATLDERHSTRGRARVLADMLDGSLADDGWRSEDALAALDLCLACKACRTECPVSVDMATYKAEFLSHHWRGRVRPRTHYTLGWLPVWLAGARVAPRLARRVLGLPGMDALLLRAGGLAADRPVPLPAATADGLRRGWPRDAGAGDGDPVVLWIDTFTASFAPEVVVDAVTLLRRAGYRVQPSPSGTCCGLTWATTGQLGVARRVMRRTLDALGAEGPPVVVLEPSCAAALRSDLPELLGSAEATSLASRVRTLAEALSGRDLDLAGPPARAVVQWHCHHRSVFGTHLDRELLTRAGIEVDDVLEGCCGMAGSFGMEPDHQEVSRTCAEQSFLPHLRAADEQDSAGGTEVVADGFSCRLQVADLGGRPSRHLAQVLRSRLSDRPNP